MAELTPLIAVHATAAVLATLTGPIAIWGRLGAKTRPRIHRAFGYAWVTLMLIAAVSAVFVAGTVGPTWLGFSLIHLFVPLTLFGLFGAFWHLLRGNIAGHRNSMIGLYVGACLTAGAFAMAPGRLMSQLIARALGQ